MATYVITKLDVLNKHVSIEFISDEYIMALEKLHQLVGDSEGYDTKIANNGSNTRIEITEKVVGYLYNGKILKSVYQICKYEDDREL
jgi:hypothetical protein